MSIHESGEMYLETIHVLLKKNGSCRSIDISEHMGYSKPSVSRAVSVLKKNGYILMDREGFITLTQAGEELSAKIYERHTILSRLLVLLGVDPEIAAQDACKLEHAISDQAFEAIKAHTQSLEK